MKAHGPICDPQIAADLLRSLAHPMRLAILCRLLDGELNVGGFEAELGLRQPSLSQQLGLLRESGLVATRREAKSVIYRIADRRVALLLDALRQYFAVEPQAGECGAVSEAGSVLASNHDRKRRHG
jgi:DNA-binding transcriptional ArsR family regulator